MRRTPRESGYRWPAEWEPHRATWLSWPHNLETWPRCLPEVEATFGAMVAALAPREALHVGVRDEPMEARARAAVRAAGWDPDRDVVFHRWPTNDAWIRDHGPIFVARSPAPRPPANSEDANGIAGASGAAVGREARSEPQASEVAASEARSEPQASEVALLDFRFDNWGKKYPDWEPDDAVPGRVAEVLGVPRFVCDAVLEGGSIDGDGAGSVLTTEQCLLHPNRSADGSARPREALERLLADQLGARRVLWLAGGIEGDDTDGHVDDVARFVAPGVVVAAVCDDASDPNHTPLVQNRRRLAALEDARGARLSVVELPMPPRIARDGHRSPASYANFYLANGIALVPVFGVPSDARALAVLRELLPGREVLGIDCRALVSGWGAIHCATQQEPLAAARPGG